MGNIRNSLRPPQRIKYMLDKGRKYQERLEYWIELHGDLSNVEPAGCGLETLCMFLWSILAEKEEHVNNLKTV